MTNCLIIGKRFRLTSNETSTVRFSQWVVNMPNFDRHSVFSLASTEAAPACLARGHWRWLRFCLDRRYSSTSLPPLAPSPLRDFTATMEALTPVGPALRPLTGCMNTVSAVRQVSLIHVLDLPFPPSPTTLGPSTSISHATPHLVESPAEAGLGFTFPTQAGRLSGRIEFLIVRMERSPPAAPHPALLRRSCSRLQAGERMPQEDFHLSDQARFQAHVGTRCCASAMVNPRRTRSTASLPDQVYAQPNFFTPPLF